MKLSLGSLTTFLVCILTAPLAAAETLVLPVTITSALPAGAIPIDVEVDFAALLQTSKLPGVFDPNSVEVTNRTTGKRESHALSPHVAYGDRARVRWLVTDPQQTKFEIRFSNAAQRTVLRPRADTPLIGVGDLLRYTGAKPRAIASSLATRLVDLNGDGVRDLVATDYYTTEPLWPERVPQSWSPFLCYPGVQAGESLLFGNAVRLRYRDKPNAPSQFFIGGYMHADVADLNGDGLPDLAFAAADKSSEASKVPDVAKFIHLYLNSGKRDAGGMPVFVYTDRVKRPPGNWGPVRIVDLDRDGAVDLVVGSLFSETNPRAMFLRNTNPAGWPLKTAAPVAFSPGAMAGFLDVDEDGTPDSICVTHDVRFGTRNFCSRVAWHKGLGGSPPQYGPEQFLEGIDDELCEFVSTVDTGASKGVLVSAGYIGERILFYELQSGAGKTPRFKRSEALAVNAPIRAGDQPTPCICDWNDDGKWDLVYGGGFGWVRVFINEGTNEKPSLAPGQHAMSEGKPINLHMTQFFPGIEAYWHDLGYVHPSFIDWDGDGLRDLVMSNVGNRIYWYRNVGTRTAPTFGTRQQVICDGYEETPERTAATAKALGAGTKQWKTFPPDAASSPFWWRARVGFGDLNGDGLMDLITADASTQRGTNNFADSLSLFTRYRDDKGQLRLRRDHIITPEGSAEKTDRLRPPSQTIVHDWDGDGLLDLIINDGGTMSTAPAVLRNIGTKTAPKFAAPKRLTCYGEELSGIAKHGPYYGIGDMDGDGRPDLIASTEVGSYLFFRRTAMDMDKAPAIQFGEVRTEAATKP